MLASAGLPVFSSFWMEESLGVGEGFVLSMRASNDNDPRVMNARPKLVKKPRPLPADARSCALNALHIITRKNMALDRAMDAPDIASLESRDRAFVKQLLMLSLKRHGEIQAIIKSALDQPDKALPSQVEDCLTLGVVQLLWMDVPDYAAIDTTVELVKTNRSPKHAGLVNAVLKKVMRLREATPATSPLMNLPEWMQKTLIADYGHETAEAICTASILEAPLDLTLVPGTSFPETDATILPNGTVRLKEHGAVPQLDGFSEGTWWVQDAAASLPAKLLGDIKGKTVLDLCAAPGGKTMQLAAAGAHVIAVDRAESRLKRVEENLQRTKLSATCIAADAKTFKPDVNVDCILLDAPCSATGTLRRNPDVAFHRTPEEILKLSTLQTALLAHASSLLKPGGKLVYCVCSLLKAEGEDIATAFLSKNTDFQVVRPDSQALGIPEEWIAEDGSLRTLPHYWQDQGGMDGFFMICLQKK